MAFSFGAQPAPAPGGGVTSFAGSSNPAPAPGGFNVPGNTSAPAAGGAFSFGGFSTGGAATSAGTASAPAPFSFAGAPTPAPGQSSFSFGGGAPSSAPAAGTTFGTPAAAAPSFNLFGAAPATSPPPSSFGAVPQQPPMAGQQPLISGNMPYSALPQQYKADVDALFNLIRNHQRTMELVKSMAPHQLAKADDQTEPALEADRERLRVDLQELSQQVFQTSSRVQALQAKADTLGKQVFLNAKCPLEAVAIRRGVRLEEEKKDESSSSLLSSKVQQLLDSQFAHVDRLERMPSPYLLESLLEWKTSAQALETEVQHQLELLATVNDDDDAHVPLESLVRVQHEVLVRNAMRLALVIKDMDEIRKQYRIYERGENVIDKADQEEFDQEQRLSDQVLLKFVEQQKQDTQRQPNQPATSAPSAGFLSGSSSASAPFSFSSTSTAAPPRTSGFSFSPSPAPSTLAFGWSGATTPAAAPTTSPFPSTTTTTFGTAPAAAPSVPGAFSFSNTSSSTSRSKKSSSRASGRVRA